MAPFFPAPTHPEFPLPDRAKSSLPSAKPRYWPGGVSVIVLCVVLMPQVACGIESVYEPGVDPAIGFNLISWWNFGLPSAGYWEDAVQSLYDAGFRDVSVCPVRYVDPATGAISISPTKSPVLSHVAGAVLRAKTLGMTVTVNPFVEYQDFTQWRGNWNPAPGSATAIQFWSDYEQYMIDVAQMAQTSGADFMNVGTELKALVRNSGHNANWSAAINVADQRFSGPLGYAANWDNFNDPNLTTAMWEHAAIDYLGIDAYFPAATDAEADASGAYPNPTFIDLVKSNWNAMFDNDILPFAGARKGGQGMPVVLTEYGLLAYNRCVPQNRDGTLDQNEQIMGFEALLSAMDHRLTDDDLLAMHVWHWWVPGGGSEWCMNVAPPIFDPNNVPAAQFLSDFASNPIPEPASVSLLALSSLVALRRMRHRRTTGNRYIGVSQVHAASWRTDEPRRGVWNASVRETPRLPGTMR